MRRAANGNSRSTRLRGKRYDPPARPAILRSDRRTQWKDGYNAKRLGGVFAEDGDVTDEEGRLWYLRKIDHEADGAIDGIRQGFDVPKDNARKAGEDARLQEEDALRELSELEELDAKLAAEEETYHV